MRQFVENPVHFSADCMRTNGRCTVVRDNFIFLDNGKELAAVDHLQRKCGHVVIIPSTSHNETALLYHTSCQRMADVIKQIFQDCLEAAESLPQSASEMSIGELHRRCLTIPYDRCKLRVDNFGF